MVTKREKLRTQLHRIKMQLFLQQSKILRKEKLRPNGREYKSISTVHKQTMSLYDQPEKVMKTSEYFENVNEVAIDLKTPQKVQRLTPVARTLGALQKLTPVKPKPKTPTENPYAKPTYKSFSWMLSSRRRSQGSNAASPENQVEESLELGGWQLKRRKGRRPRSAVGVERACGEDVLKMDSENAGVCNVSSDISDNCIQKIDSLQPDLSNDKYVSTKQETCSVEVGNSDSHASTKPTTCSPQTNHNSPSEVAKTNVYEEPSKGGTIDEQPQKRRRGRPPKVRVTQCEQVNTSVCQEKDEDDTQCSGKKVNCSDVGSPDTFSVIKQESDCVDEVCGEKEVGDCTLENGTRLEESVQSESGLFYVAPSGEQGRDPSVEPNNTDSVVEHPTDLLGHNPKSGSDEQAVCNDFEPLLSCDLEKCKSTASPHRLHNLKCLYPSHLDSKSTSPSNEHLIKASENDKCCKEKQTETLPNSSSVEENAKVACVLQISKELEHSKVSAELTTRSLDRKKCVPFRNARLNWKRKQMSSVAKCKSNRSFGGKHDCSDVDEQQSRTAVHLKENGRLKNQPTMERFLQRSKQEPEKAEAVKRNGSLYEKQDVCDEACVASRTDKLETMDCASEGLSQRRSSSGASDSGTPSPSSRSAVSPLNLPNRKRGVHSDSNVRSKKRLRYAKGGKESVPPGGTCSDVDVEGMGQQPELKDVDSKLTNGFSPVNHRYRTRQSLGPS